MATPRIKLQETSAYFNKLTILIKTKLDINKEEKNETKFTQSQNNRPWEMGEAIKVRTRLGAKRIVKLPRRLSAG